MQYQSRVFIASIFIAVASAAALVAQDAPHLRKQGKATQLIVDGKPFLAVAGELGNNSASSLEYMRTIWPKLVSGNLNCVLAAVSWAQVEPREGQFEFSLLDGLLEEARNHKLKLVLLWFGSWKNGLSSYTPYWVKQDYKRFPRIRLSSGRGMELLSTFGDASRDADAKAFRALMRHLKSVDGREHTVLMVQVENEVGVLRDSRDRSDAANRAFAGQVPKELMDHLRSHRDTLAPELLEVWKANGSKASGSWEEVFGPGKPDSVPVPIRTTSPPMSKEEFDTAWRKLTWPADEFFMAWHYARYINRVMEEGKAEYNLPMFVNAWLQGPNSAWPGTYPSGGPLPQVHDIWRAGAPACDMLSPDIYLPVFDEVSERFIRNGNPFFIPETSMNASNAMMAFGKYGVMGFSPFYIERRVTPESDLAAAYRVITDMAPVIAAQQGKDTITAIRMKLGAAAEEMRLGDYTLRITFLGRGRIPIAPEPAPTGAQAAPSAKDEVEGAAILAATGKDEFYFAAVGGAFRIALTPSTPGPPIAGLGDVQEGRFVDGKWTVIRQLGGDDTGQGEILSVRPSTVSRVTVYRYQ